MRHESQALGTADKALNHAWPLKAVITGHLSLEDLSITSIGGAKGTETCPALHVGSARDWVEGMVNFPYQASTISQHKP